MGIAYSKEMNSGGILGVLSVAFEIYGTTGPATLHPKVAVRQQ
jgi:hypothetical protein